MADRLSSYLFIFVFFLFKFVFYFFIFVYVVVFSYLYFKIRSQLELKARRCLMRNGLPPMIARLRSQMLLSYTSDHQCYWPSGHQQYYFHIIRVLTKWSPSKKSHPIIHTRAINASFIMCAIYSYMLYMLLTKWPPLKAARNRFLPYTFTFTVRNHLSIAARNPILK